MLSPVLSKTSRTLRVLPLRMQLCSKDLALPGSASALWHSGLGISLKRHFPGVFQLLFCEQAQGRLYTLQPPLAGVKPGHPFELGIHLFGEASEHAPACAQAIARLSESGLGERQGRFELFEARVGDATEPFLDARFGLTGWPSPNSASVWLDVAQDPAQRVHVEFTTPVCIKENNQQYFGPVTFTQLIRRLQGRLAQLCEAAREANPLGRDRAIEQLAAAENVTLEHSALSWQEIKRRSGRTGNTMNFGGMTGSLVYQGELAPFLGLLKLGEVMQLGGKTAFGFGCIRTQVIRKE